MDYEIAGIDINDFEKKVFDDDNLSPEFKLGAMVLIKRYKLLINCNINEYKYLIKCMGGTTKLIDDVNNTFRFGDEVSQLEDLSIGD
tara:strand:+ start:4474 stop:4734 length:261 start_codon:yes stop_codon:yes gene_type:complete